MECCLAVPFQADTTWKSVQVLEDCPFEIVWGKSRMDEQCLAELSDLATVEIDNGGVCQPE